MAHFCKIENNIVREVIVVNNETLENKEFPESEAIGVAFCQSLFGADTQWKQTSYNGTFRATFAGAGMVYNKDKDIFEAPTTTEGSN